MENFTLNAQERNISGKQVSQLRQKGLIPAIVYGKDEKNESITVDKKEFQKIYKSVGENTLIDLKIENKIKKTLISDMQIDPITMEPIHIDFHQVKLTEKVHAEVPLEFIKEEEAPAIRELEGTLVKSKDEVEVESLPSDIPHSIEVDISSLKTFDDIIHISDLVVPQNIKIIDDPEDVVVLVEVPRSEEELKELEQKVVEDVEKVHAVEEKKEEEAGEKPTEEAK